jgi:arylsulfatase A-like enzyme
LEDWTVAKVLKEEANYTTALFGKWGLGDFNTTGYPLEQGFDIFIGQDSQVACHNWYPAKIQNGTNGSSILLSNEFPNRNGAYCIEKGNTSCTWMNDLVTQESIEFIRNHHGQDNPSPFFIYLSTTTPHVGNLEGVNSAHPTPYKYFGPFAQKQWPDNQKHFAGAVWAQDNILGSIVDELKTLGIHNNTVIFFSGDNGPDFVTAQLDNPGPFRGKKRSLHEGGVRQTIIASWPGTIINKDAELDDLFAFWDFLPTAAAIAGIDELRLPAHDGINMLPAMLNQPEHQQNHTYLYWEYCDYNKVDGLLPQQYEGGWIQAVRFDDAAANREWKSIRVNRNNETVLLYDLTTDISESHNLASQFPEVVKTAFIHMDDAHVEIPTWSSVFNASEDKCCAQCFKFGGCGGACSGSYPQITSRE